jgi:hypothetical protein
MSFGNASVSLTSGSVVPAPMGRNGWIPRLPGVVKGGKGMDDWLGLA